MYEVEFTMEPKVRVASQADFTHSIAYIVNRIELNENRWDGEVQLRLVNDEEEGTIVSCPEFTAENDEQAKGYAVTWLRTTLGGLLGCAPDEVIFENLTWTRTRI
ncbi:MAG TPA: hypothetical protein VFH06_04965 [Candidatus Saccharimonadales bacterium]|nr:hypothetical protein [Candidatus Saccharimonadales bacterium]